MNAGGRIRNRYDWKIDYKVNFEIVLALVKGHNKNSGTCQYKPLLHLLQLCDNKAAETRENIEMKLWRTNIKFYSLRSLERRGMLQSRSTNETLRIADARKYESECAKKNMVAKKTS